MGYSFTDLTREGDRAGQEWFEKMGTPQEPERPGVEAYELLSRLVDGYSLRGWSHYVFSYADPARWNATMDSHVGRVTEDRRDIWEQWQRWPGPFCRPAFSQWFEITDAFGYVLEGKLVSAAQLLAHSNEFAWEFGIDTLSEFRRRGFAGAVVNTVTTHIIDRGRVPYYYADAYNKASLHVIRKSGYFHYGDGVVAHAR
jgi:RimJ/RimL family protein N-acetyltransferase